MTQGLLIAQVSSDRALFDPKQPVTRLSVRRSNAKETQQTYSGLSSLIVC